MDLTVKARNMDLTDAVQQYVEKKLGRLTRHMHNLREVKVELAKEATKDATQRYIVQVTCDTNGPLLRAEERAEEVHTAIDAAAAVLDRQIERFKGRWYYRGRHQGPRAEIPVDALEAEAPGMGKVVKVKRFAFKPMSAAEAAAQMELLGHSFFFFLNEETDQFNVLYCRQDGNYGLIQPE